MTDNIQTPTYMEPLWFGVPDLNDLASAIGDFNHRISDNAQENKRIIDGLNRGFKKHVKQSIARDFYRASIEKLAIGWDGKLDVSHTPKPFKINFHEHIFDQETEERVDPDDLTIEHLLVQNERLRNCVRHLIEKCRKSGYGMTIEAREPECPRELDIHDDTSWEQLNPAHIFIAVYPFRDMDVEKMGPVLDICGFEEHQDKSRVKAHLELA